MTLQKICCSCFRRSVGIFKNFSVICRVCKPQYAAISRDIKKLPQKGNMVQLILVFLRNDSKLYNSLGLATKEIQKTLCYLFDHNRYLHLLFNNNALEKCNINPRTPSRFGMLFKINLQFYG